MSTPQLEEVWLTDLFGQHSRAVLAYARRRLNSAEDAEDVVVEVFATAWRRRDVVPEEALPWLYSTAGNVIAHTIRSESRRTRLGARLATVRPLHTAQDDPGDQVVEAHSAHDTVSAALEDVSESDAELLRLWAWEQLEPNEIAEVLDCSAGTARTRLHRARTRLREALIARGVDDPAIRPSQGDQPPGPGQPGGDPSATTPATTPNTPHHTPRTANGSEE